MVVASACVVIFLARQPKVEHGLVSCRIFENLSGHEHLATPPLSTLA